MDRSVVLEGVHAGYSKDVLSGMSLKVEAGSFCGIVGPNGAGKTTLLRVISGLVAPSQGTVTVLERTIKSLADGYWLRRRIGYLAQVQSAERFPITVEDAILLGRWGRYFSGLRRPGKNDYQRVEELLELVGLAKERTHDLRDLSGGQRQRAALARSLARDPEILLMDEPTTYLDPDAQRELVCLVQTLQRQLGITIIVVTHMIWEQWSFQRCLLMQSGRIVEELL